MREKEDSSQIRRVQCWIERLERKATELLDGLPLEELTPKHQADIALKCLDHLRHFTATEKMLQDCSQANEKQELLAKITREARGEDEPATESSDEMEEEDEHEY